TTRRSGSLPGSLFFRVEAALCGIPQPAIVDPCSCTLGAGVVVIIRNSRYERFSPALCIEIGRFLPVGESQHGGHGSTAGGGRIIQYPVHLEAVQPEDPQLIIRHQRISQHRASQNECTCGSAFVAPPEQNAGYKVCGHMYVINYRMGFRRENSRHRVVKFQSSHWRTSDGTEMAGPKVKMSFCRKLQC